MNILNKIRNFSFKYRIIYDPIYAIKYRIQRKSWIPFYWVYSDAEDTKLKATENIKKKIRSKIIHEYKIKSRTVIPISMNKLEKEVLMEDIAENIKDE